MATRCSLREILNSIIAVSPTSITFGLKPEMFPCAYSRGLGPHRNPPASWSSPSHL